MPVISSENPSDEAWTAFQGYWFGLQNFLSPYFLFADIVLAYFSLVFFL